MRHHARARHRWHRERWSVALLAAAALIAVSGCGGVDTAEAKTKQRGRRGAMTGASKYSKSASAAASGEASRDVYDNEMMDLDVDEFEAVVMHPTVHHFVIFFHHQNCRHCVGLLPQFERAATSFPRKAARFAIVDVTAEIGFQKQHGLTEFPRISVYLGPMKQVPSHLPGWRSQTVPKDIQIADFLRSVVKEKLEGAVEAAYGEGIIDADDVADAFDDDEDDGDDDPENGDRGDGVTMEPYLTRNEL